MIIIDSNKGINDKDGFRREGYNIKDFFFLFFSALRRWCEKRFSAKRDKITWEEKKEEKYGVCKKIWKGTHYLYSIGRHIYENDPNVYEGLQRMTLLDRIRIPLGKFCVKMMVRSAKVE